MIAIYVAAQVAEPTPTARLELICRGETVLTVPVSRSSAQAIDNEGRSARATGVTEQAVATDAVVKFRLDEGAGFLSLPASFLPGFHGGNAGWLPVQKLRVTDREITGTVNVNFLYHPTFRIDRMTGRMSSSGGFDAPCEKIDLEHQKF